MCGPRDIILSWQISCVSSSAELENQLKFPRYFQISASERNLVDGFYGIIREYNWTRVAIITQDENLFTTVSRWGLGLGLGAARAGPRPGWG